MSKGQRASSIVDLRVAIYDTGKGDVANITFYNDMHKLLDCKRVKFTFIGDCCYFINGDDSVRSCVLSEKASVATIQVQRNIEQLKRFEGEYLQLNYDNITHAYYINLNDKLSTTYTCTKKGTTINREKSDMRDANVIKPVLPVDNVTKKSAAQINAEKIVISALFALLETQVSDNADALATIKTMRNYI